MAENVGGIVWTASIETQGLVNGERAIQRSTRAGEKGFNKLDQSVQRTNNSMMTMSRIARSVISVIAIRQITSYADAFTNVQNRLKVVTDSSEQLADVTQKVSDIARESRSNLESTAILYSRLARSTEELNISQERMLGITSTITKSFTLSGATAEEASNAIRQLSQGFAAGALRGEEFNSVAEQAPEILRAVAIETGMSVGALREFAAEGGITSELLIRALENYGDTVDKEFKQTTATISQSFEVARTNVIEYVGALDESLGATDAAGSAIVVLSNNLDKLVMVLGAVAAIYAGRMAGALAGNIAAFVSARVQAVRYQATLASMAGVSRTAAAGLGAMTLAARGASAAMALLGGPVGAILVATSAFVAIASAVSDASDEQERNARVVDELTQKYSELNEQQIRNRAATAQQQLNEITSKRLELLKEISSLESQPATGGLSSANILGMSGAEASGAAERQERLRELRSELSSLDTVSDELRNELASLFNVLNQEVTFDEEIEKVGEASKESQKTLAKLAMRNEELRAELSRTNDELEVRRALLEAGVEAGTAEANVIEDIVRGNQALTKSIEDRDAAQKASEDAENRLNSLAEEIRLLEVKNALGNEEYERQAAIAALGPDASAEDVEKISNMITQMQALRNEAELVGESLQEAFRGVGLQALDDFSDGLARAAVEGSSVRDMIHGISKTILTELLSSVIRYWTGQAAAALAGQSAVTAQTAAAAGASAAAWTPAATLASIATLGGAAGIGTVALTGALASTQGMTAASGGLAGAFGGARQYGGPVASDKAYRVNETEPEMFVSGGQQYLMPNMRGEVMNSDQVGGGDVKVSVQVNNNAPGVDVGVREQGSGNNRQFILDVVKADITSYGQSTVGALSTVTNIKRKTQ